MNLLIARGGLEGSDVLAFLLSAGILLIIVLIVIAKLREAIAPRRIGNRMKRFFGPDVKLLQAHEKTFPGWDLGSLSRAVASFVDECCESPQRLGSVAVACSIQPLIPTEQENALARAKPVTLTYERLPVDVERDESFVSNALYFAITRPDVTAQARAAARPALPRPQPRASASRSSWQRTPSVSDPPNTNSSIPTKAAAPRRRPPPACSSASPVGPARSPISSSPRSSGGDRR
jgi:hypothetical protein